MHKQESAWLIESNISKDPSYFTGAVNPHGTGCYSFDPWAAQRYDTEGQALATKKTLNLPGTVVSHMFVTEAPKEPTVSLRTVEATCSEAKDCSIGFSRENRYLVLKLTDLKAALTPTKQMTLYQLAEEVDTNRRVCGKGQLRCVVVESDWPEYEPTWEAIQQRATGKVTPSQPTCPECGSDAMDTLDGVYGCADCGFCPGAPTLEQATKTHDAWYQRDFMSTRDFAAEAINRTDDLAAKLALEECIKQIDRQHEELRRVCEFAQCMAHPLYYADDTIYLVHLKTAHEINRRRIVELETVVNSKEISS